jgi:peptidoglycan-associated lipoprotein
MQDPRRVTRRSQRAGCLALLGAALGAATVGCGPKEPPKPEGTVASATATARPPGVTRQDTVTPTSGSIHIDASIIKACGDIPTAHFAFDSAKIQPDAAAVLDALARCFVSGPLKGRGMNLIGHADPRGEHEYNFALGQRRAGSVGAYISGKGLDASKVQASSRGDTDATGTDEEGWARDRKVDVLLAN